ncbi:MAG: phosphoglycerate kinase [Clostridiales bacterium]|jgi:phosphoglycerate kinase|nr:phosphoglycerate kinase [Clostridiales bacterium]
MKKMTLKDIDVSGKKVLVRVDFNVPLKDGQVADDTRIRAALPTIEYLINNNAAVILMSHLGRPKGEVKEDLKMDPVAQRLADLLGKEVKKTDDCTGSDTKKEAEKLQPGEILLLENTRFNPEEKKNDPGFAKELASLAEIFVNDAFGAAHRAHASTVGVADYLPAVAGFLMEKEIDVLSKALTAPEHPFVAIIGGAKISDKIGVIENLIDKVDTLIIGGGMANTFLKAKGYDMAESLVEDDKVDLAKELMQKYEENGVNLLLPTDLVVAREMKEGAATQVVAANEVPAGYKALDIGPETAQQYVEAIKDAKTVIWNGPMGVFEIKEFAEGTMKVANAMANCRGKTIIGGGDSVAAVEKAGVTRDIFHISTGGGASLEFLEGKELPGVVALKDKSET